MTINKAHTRVELVEGGSIFKQGDHASLAFTPRDYAGQVVDLSGKDIEVVILGRKGIIYESTATFDTDAQLIRVEIDQTLDHGSFRIEFIVTDPSDATYRRIFPSEESDGGLTISPSSDNIDFVGVNMTTVSQLRSEQEALQTEFAAEVLPRVHTVEGRQDEVEATVQAGIGAFTEDTEVVLARMGEANLLALNEKTAAQLAETAKKTDLQGLSLAYKESYDTLALLQTAYPTGDVYNHTVKADGLIYTYAKGTWTSTGIQANGTGIADKTVTPEKTIFFDYESSKNIFNTTWEVGGLDAAGAIQSRTDMARAKGFLLVTPSKQYTLKLHELGITDLAGFTIYLTQYDSAEVFLKRSSISNVNTMSFTTEPTAGKVKFHLYKSGVTGANLIPPKTQLELGGTSTSYVPFAVPFLKSELLKIPKFTEMDATFFEVGKNLFNVLWEANGIDNNGLERTTTTEARTRFFKIEPGIYTVTFTGIAGVSVYMYRYDAQGNFIDFVTIGLTHKYTFVIPSNVATIRFKTYKSAANGIGLIPTTTQVEKGSVSTTYEKNRLVFDGDYLDPQRTAEKLETSIKESIQFENEHVKAIAHRGYSGAAPEGTYHAYVLAKEKGFKYVECDVQWTLDEQPVLFHDTTLDSKSSGTGLIKDHTLAQLKEMDFGNWFSPEFAGTKILTFNEFIMLCKKLNLKPYIDLKDTLSQARAETLVTAVKKIGMLRAMTWCGGFASHDNIRLYDEKARIATLPATAPTDFTPYTQRLTDELNVFLFVNHEIITQDLSDRCAENGIGLEAWIVNDATIVNTLAQLNVQGIETDLLNIPKVLHDSYVTP